MLNNSFENIAHHFFVFQHEGLLQKGEPQRIPYLHVEQIYGLVGIVIVLKPGLVDCIAHECEFLFFIEIKALEQQAPSEIHLQLPRVNVPSVISVNV